MRESNPQLLDMKSIGALLICFPLLQVCTVQGKTGSRVLLFPEAWALSQCRTLDVSVPVLQEFPSLVQYIYSPGCVPLRRCSGCCRDELLQCLPSSTRNVSIQLLRIDPAERSREYVVLSFLEHQRCECRPRRQHLRLQHKKRRKEKLKRRRRRRRGRKDRD